MKHKITWVARLFMAGLLYTQAPISMSATCIDDEKLCQDLTSSEKIIQQNSTSSSLNNAKTELIQDLTALPDAKLSQPESNTLVAKFDKALEDKLYLVNNECSPLRWTEERTIEFDRELVADPSDLGPDAGVAGPIGMKVPPPNARLENLGTGLNRLKPVDVGNPVSTILTPPVTITGASLIGALPGNLQFDYFNGQVAIYTPCKNGLQTDLVHPSTTTRFNIRLYNSVGSTDLDVVLPVNLFTRAVIQVLNPGYTVDRALQFSGGPISCASMPAGVSCGPVSWNYQAMAGSSIPQGVSLQSLADGRGHLQGNVQDAAYSSAGKIRLSQQQDSFQTDAIFEVPVSLTPVQLSVMAEVQEIERSTAFSFQLPQPRGGDGLNYQWRVDYNSDQLPAGLTLAGDTISGTVLPGAEIGTRELQLIVSSSLNYPGMRHPEKSAPMTFRLTVPFSLWTQNTFMRPPDLPAVVHDSIDTTLDILTSIVGGIICGLPCAAGGLLTSDALSSELAEAIENAYDNKVQNTTADNQQRMAHIINRVTAQNYDIVALQEVFQFDPGLNNGITLAHIAQLRNALGSQYDFLDGPPPAGIEMNSGLTLLVRKGLTLNPQYSHVPEPYQNDPLMVNVNGQDQLNFDALAQKGMTIDRIQFGPLTNDYIYVVNTHMQAEAGSVFDNLRAAQQNELYNFIALHTDSAHPVVIVGDFNVIEAVGTGLTRLQTPEYQGMLNRLGLGLNDDLLRVQQNPGANADAFTIDPSRNLYASNWGGSAIERLDYILVRQGSHYQLVADSVEMTDFVITTSQCTGWQNPTLPNLQCYLSDHFGLSAQLRLVRQ